MRIRQRVYSPRVYRNTILFGAALLAGAVALLIAEIWFMAAVPGWLRAILAIADAAGFFFGGAYAIAGLYGLARVK